MLPGSLVATVISSSWMKQDVLFIDLKEAVDRRIQNPKKPTLSQVMLFLLDVQLFILYSVYFWLFELKHSCCILFLTHYHYVQQEPDGVK